MQREGAEDLEVRLASAWAELEGRDSTLGSDWAIRFDRRDAVSLRDARQTYLFHYFLSVLSAESGVNAEGRRLFEEAVADLVRGLGASHSYRIGHDTPREIAPTFREAVERYVALCGEELVAAPVSTDNDLGLDVAAWVDLGTKRLWDESISWVNALRVGIGTRSSTTLA